MSKAETIPILERPAFFDGQQLTAADLEAVHNFHRELRWLHNRSLHNWGIASGYAVNGRRGERSVEVQPGYAVDCRGRELILSTGEKMPIPAVSGAEGGGPAQYHLTASYADAEALDQAQRETVRQGVCGSAGAVRRAEKPLLAWKTDDGETGAARYRNGLDVVLATIKVLNCKLAEEVSTAERRDALPPRQPYVAAGKTAQGRTTWRNFTDASGRAVLGVRTTVNTTDARFHTTPRYQARVAGKRTYQPENDGDSPVLIEGYPYIQSASASGFELWVVLPTLPPGAGGQFRVNEGIDSGDFLERLRCAPDDQGCFDGKGLGWHVVWMGVE